jgi:hypothetical protein
MKKIDLIKVKHEIKIGAECPDKIPNISEDCIFYEDGNPIGFFINNIEGKLKQFVDIAAKELRGKGVPKTMMDRKKPLGEDANGKKEYLIISQYSTIIGSVPPKPMMRRPYPSISSVHNVPSAKTFIKAMLLACRESEELIKKILPEQFDLQQKIINENVPKEFRFGRLFTSSISNYNISAPFHRDAGNLEHCVNVIITRRKNATGGNLHVPDYDATMDSSNNSLLVYPAWKNIHGVTPIHETAPGGYRNSLIFYPLKAFKKFV